VLWTDVDDEWAMGGAPVAIVDYREQVIETARRPWRWSVCPIVLVRYPGSGSGVSKATTATASFDQDTTSPRSTHSMQRVHTYTERKRVKFCNQRNKNKVLTCLDNRACGELANPHMPIGCRAAHKELTDRPLPPLPAPPTPACSLKAASLHK